MEASPAPRPPARRRRWWLWGLVLLVLVLVVGAVALATFPRWGAGRVRVALEERLSRRLETPVRIQRLEMDWESIELRQVHFDEPVVELQRVEVSLAEHMLWSLGAEAQEVRIDGGRVTGTRAELEALARRVVDIARDEGESGSGWRARVRLRPERLELRSIDVDVDAEKGMVRMLQGRVGGTFFPREERGELEVEAAAVQAEFFGPRLLTASSVKTKLERKAGALVFPLAVKI